MLRKKVDNIATRFNKIIATRYVQLYIIVENAARQSIGSGMHNILMIFIPDRSGTVVSL